MKAIVNEKHKDWQARFGLLGVKLAKLTGDESTHPKHLEEADVMLTTPEKWDAFSR